MSDEIEPRPISTDEIELLKKYRDLSMPAARLAGLDDFAKWLFSSIAVIGTLAAGFSTSAIKTFDARSAAVFFAAIFMTGVSLFLAVCLRAVGPKKANYYSLPDMLEKDDQALRVKQILAAGSGAFFALVVLTAGFSPLASAIWHRPAPQLPKTLLYSYGKDGLKTSASFSNGPHAISEMKVTAQVAAEGRTTEALLAVQRMVSGDDGIAKLEVAASTVNPATTSITIGITCDPAKHLTQTVVLRFSQAAVAPMDAKSGCVI
jgi:hypothetical protein